MNFTFDVPPPPPPDYTIFLKFKNNNPKVGQISFKVDFSDLLVVISSFGTVLNMKEHFFQKCQIMYPPPPPTSLCTTPPDYPFKTMWTKNFKPNRNNFPKY